MFRVGRTNINLIKYINYPGSWKSLLLCNQKCTKRLKITKLMKMINFARKFSCQCTQNHRSEKGVAFGQCWLTHSAERAIYDLHAKKLLFPHHNPRLQLTINDSAGQKFWSLAFYYNTQFFAIFQYFRLSKLLLTICSVLVLYV